MQFRTLVAALVFVGSYLPLSLILLSQDFKYEYLSKSFCSDWKNFGEKCEIPLENPVYAITFCSMCLLCLCVTLKALSVVKPRHSIVVIESKHIPADLMNYVLPYVVSFMSLDYRDSNKLVGFSIFLAWIFWISHMSGRVIFNPVLIAFGWRLFEVKYSFSSSPNILTGFALSKVDLVPRQTYKQHAIQDVLIIKAKQG